MLWGALRRVGLQPGILDDAQFHRGDYTNAPALILSRCMNMDPVDLDKIATNVIPAGIHVFSDADFPGQFDPYGRSNPNWVSRINTIFGLNVASARPAYDSVVTNTLYNGTINFTGVTPLGPFGPGYSAHLGTWKIWSNLQGSAGVTVLTQNGNNGTGSPVPALQITTNRPAKTAALTFAIGDCYEGVPNQVPQRLWDTRYDFIHAIFRDHFGIQPVVEVTGVNSKYILPDYRICQNGSVLISLLNEDTNIANITVSSPKLLAGKIVENLTTGGIISTNSNGQVSLTMTDDDYVLLYAYSPTAGGGAQQSLVNSNQNKLWFQSAPAAIWPSLSINQVTIGYDTQETDLTSHGAEQGLRCINPGAD